MACVLADLNTPEGQAFASRHGVGNTTLVLVVREGNRLETLVGIQEEGPLRWRIQGQLWPLNSVGSSQCRYIVGCSPVGDCGRRSGGYVPCLLFSRVRSASLARYWPRLLKGFSPALASLAVLARMQRRS